MSVRATIAPAMIALALAVPASAGTPGIFNNKYEGRVERAPNTYFGFDVTKQQGVTKVKKVTALVHYNCDNGDGGMAAARVKGRLRVKNGRFAGTLSARLGPVRASLARQGPSGSSRFRYRVKGELLGNGRAKGTIDATLRFNQAAPPPRGGGTVRCYSGKLDWKARRGANVSVPA